GQDEVLDDDDDDEHRRHPAQRPRHPATAHALLFTTRRDPANMVVRPTPPGLSGRAGQATESATRAATASSPVTGSAPLYPTTMALLPSGVRPRRRSCRWARPGRPAGHR